MKFKINGMDQLQKQIETIKNQAQEVINGEITLTTLFTDEFMIKHTCVSSIEKFVEESPLADIKIEKLEQFNNPEMDMYVRTNTSFSNWNDFIQLATKEYAVEKLKVSGFNVK